MVRPSKKKLKKSKLKFSQKMTTASPLQAYFRKIGSIPITTREEEIELGKGIQNGDEQAFNRLVEGNLKFVVNIAQQYQGCGLDLLDLINEGNLGLIEAAKRFNPSKGVKFISYGVWWVRQAIMQALAEQGSIIRIPMRQADMIIKLGKVYKDLMQEKIAESPSPEDLASRLNIPVKKVESLLGLSWGPLSLDTPISDNEGTTFVDTIRGKNYLSPEQWVIKESLMEELRELLSGLDPREETILKLRYGINGGKPMTLAEIGKQLNLSRERVRQLEKRAKERLKKRAITRSLEDYLN
ncbi:MAG TPA: RNA polymerase sigma factor RpoD/SigA [Candidatus Limnocylindrales bacterium]|nr:RNA polymerase sigma factor RpoD/SigA [Candidatus Limnocylindrales bacterium]